MLGSRNNSREVPLNLLAQLKEGRNPATLRPGHPPLESVLNLIRGGLNRQPEVLLQQEGTLEPGDGLADLLQQLLLRLGEEVRML